MSFIRRMQDLKVGGLDGNVPHIVQGETASAGFQASVPQQEIPSKATWESWYSIVPSPSAYAVMKSLAVRTDFLFTITSMKATSER